MSVNRRWSTLTPVKASSGPTARTIGRLPEDAWISVIRHCTIPDIRAIALACRKLNQLAKDDRIWAYKLQLLAFKGTTTMPLSRLTSPQKQALNGSQSKALSVTFSPLAASTEFASQHHVNSTGNDDGVGSPDPSFNEDDGFGEFVNSEETQDPFGLTSAAVQKPADLLISFEEDIGTFSGNGALPKQSRQSQPSQAHSHAHAPVAKATTVSSKPSNQLSTFKSVYSFLMSFYVSLHTHTTSSLVFTQPNLSQMDKAHILHTLTKLVLQELAPTRSTATLTVFRRNLQSSIDNYEASLLSQFEAADEANLENQMKAFVGIALELNGGYSIAQVFLNKRGIFYEATSLYNPLLNLVKAAKPTSPQQEGQSKKEMVDGLDFSAMEQFMNHVTESVDKDGSLCARVFGPAAATVLVEFADRIAQDVISEYITPLLAAAQSLTNPLFMLATAATFAQSNRLQAAILAIATRYNISISKAAIDHVIYRMFEIHMDDYLGEEADWIKTVLVDICTSWTEKTARDNLQHATTSFLTASNPTQVKRNVLNSFGKALMLPVTIVPKTVVYSLNAVTTGAFNAVAQMAGGGMTQAPLVEAVTETVDENRRFSLDTQLRPKVSDGGDTAPHTSNEISDSPGDKDKDTFSKLQLLLSLDVALQLIQADRESLARVETFQGFHGITGTKVRDTIEEIFIVLLQTLGEKHIVPAFQTAERHMASYRPAEHGAEHSVAPLVQFFELVHIADTMSQMIQVFYDKEMANHIDKTDFLNIVVREKKKFETSLDDSVATGLNTGVQLLINQAEHLLTTLQEPTDFCPTDATLSEGLPTKACSAVIDALKMHCDLLKGSTDKQILDVFHVEIGIRLHALIMKHLKRSMISPDGGLQVITDINAYHAFIMSLKQPTITPYFTALKMVSHLYIVDSPKDMAAMVKDVQRYEGTLRSEDAYELLQRRTDWRLKEKAVDKALYGLSTEDCLVS